MRHPITVLCLASALACCGMALAGQTPSTSEELSALRTGDMAKLHSLLRALAEPTAIAAAQSRTPLMGRLPRLGMGTGNASIRVNIIAKGDGNALKSQLQALGLTHASAVGSLVSGRIALTELKTIAALDSVLTVRPALSATRTGLVTTQGDRAQGSVQARRDFGVNGSGVKVGILSDSFNCLKSPFIAGQMFTTKVQDVANGDLPSNTQIIEDPTPCNGLDEGRAIGQIVHDVAPGASLAFYTADDSEADFANGITALADAGANVIIDDVLYYDEPMFQDGIVAQAVDAVHDRGVAYFSSSGNEARQSYESDFRASGSKGLSGVRHNFGTAKNPDPLQTVSVTDGALELLVLNWDEPYRSAGPRGSRSDVDLIFYRMNGQLIPFCDDNLQPAVCQFPGIDENIGTDPLEEAVISNTTGATVNVQVSIELHQGPAPTHLKYVYFALGAGAMLVDEHDTESGSSYGHANSAGALGVGAAPWYNTAAWGAPFWSSCRPACLEYFSSAGGTPIFFSNSGQRLAKPVVRQDPGVVAPDGGNTSFFYSVLTATVPGSTEPDVYPNFFGTSAAAPHAGSIAALMIDKQARAQLAPLSPDKIYGILEATAKDMRFTAGRTIAPYPFPFGTKGVDFDSGYGFVDAGAAVAAVGH